MITAKILKLDEASQYTRLIYPTSVVEETLRKGGLPKFGTLGEPNNLYTDMALVSHVIERVYVEDGWLVADIRIIDTECGRIVAAAMPTVEFKPAGVGNVSDDMVVSNYDLIGVWAKLKTTNNQQEGEEE